MHPRADGRGVMAADRLRRRWHARLLPGGGVRRRGDRWVRPSFRGRGVTALARALAGINPSVGACRSGDSLDLDRDNPRDGAPLNRALCASFGVPGLGTDSSLCAFPQSCLGGGVCAPGGPPSPTIPNPRIGCLPPAGMCSVGGGCVPTNTRPGGLSACMACQPSVSPWALTPLPVGSPCTAPDDCIINESCNAAGLCAGEYTTEAECLN